MKTKIQFYSISERHYEDDEFETFTDESMFVDYMLKLNKEFEDCIGDPLTVIAYGDNFTVSSFYWDDSYEECEDDAKINYISLAKVEDKDSLLVNILKELYKCLVTISLYSYTIVFDYHGIPYEISIQKEDNPADEG